jgi:hypothetical protein
VVSCHFFANLEVKSLHTHTHYMSWAGSLHYVGRVTFVFVLLVYHLHVLIILTCSMTSFSRKEYVCVLLSLWRLYLCWFLSPLMFSSAICFVYIFVELLNLYYTVSRILLRSLGGVIFYFSWLCLLLCLSFVPLWQKGGVIFILDRDCISKPAKGGVC